MAHRFGKIFFFIFYLSITAISFSQKGTIYYKKNWDVTPNKDSAAYYRLWTLENAVYKVEDYYINGKLQMKGSCKSLDPEIREGFFEYYSEDGSLHESGEYKSDLRMGIWNVYNPQGKVQVTKKYYKDKMDGPFISYYKSGKPRREEEYGAGKFLRGKCFTETGADTTYFPFEEMPEYTGGTQAMTAFIKKNVKYPKKARKNEIEGKVNVKFVVSKTGKIENAEIINSVDELLDEEALRVVRSMPDWKPGRLDGYPVPVNFNLPITFRLKN